MTSRPDTGGISGSRATHRANSSVVSTKGFDPGRIVELVTRTQWGRGGPSLCEEMLMRHPKWAWCSNVHYSTSVFRKLERLGLVEGTPAHSRLTHRGSAIREQIKQERNAIAAAAQRGET